MAIAATGPDALGCVQSSPLCWSSGGSARGCGTGAHYPLEVTEGQRFTNCTVLLSKHFWQLSSGVPGPHICWA